MTRNTAPPAPAVLPPALRERSLVLIGMMGAGKSAIGRRIAARLGLPFRDADAEIEQAAGTTISELFRRYGEPYFRDGERRVIRRLLANEPIVLATGGGAFMDRETRANVRARAIAVWLRCALPVLVRRVGSRSNRPLLANGNPAEILGRLMVQRHPVYAEADVIVDCGDEPPDVTTSHVLAAIAAHAPATRLTVKLAGSAYEVVAGERLLARAGALLAPVLPQKRVVVVTDDTVGALHLPALLAGLAKTEIEATTISVRPGEAAKSMAGYAALVDGLIEAGVERRTTVVALGGGVVGDLAGFAAATTLRGLPFVQVPTTLLAQVDSSVGGKTGVNTTRGKNLVGAFHQPLMVLADSSVLETLPLRELQAGYAETVKAGLIGDAAFYAWCEAHGSAVVGGDPALRAEAVTRACAFKARVVAEDEREEKSDGGRALLNLGHTFGHALEAEIGYGGILHGEAVAVGIGLAFALSARLGVCGVEEGERVRSHLASVGLPAGLNMLNRRFSAASLMAHMQRDKKKQDGQLKFVLTRGIGQAFTSRDVPANAVRDLLLEEGCET